MILKKLFQRNYCKNCLYKSSFYEHLQKYNNLEKENDYYTKLENFIRNLADRKEKILHFDNSKEKLFIVTVEEDYDYTGKLLHLNFYGYNYNNLLFTYYKPQRLYVDVCQNGENEYSKHFFIYETLVVPNKGYGSIMMEVLINYAKSLAFNIEYISGFLSFVDTADEEHNQRLRHFYSKFGFTIDDKDNIKLQLNK